ncbi:cupin domain-containing protein [Synechococcus elongatus]|uniref:cupin domain-containing protein n=1 Tax=Synechococcus elongatus TaxID=32046 RepID=UPI000F7F1437|nr:cupin domain-containing protein [Synechococcus elongatus]
MNKLQDLLGSQNLSVFLSHYWAKKSVYIAGDSLRFQSLFSWNHLNDLLNYQTFRESELRFSRDGESLPAGDHPTLWRSRLQEGATLVMNGVHHRVPALKHLATNLRQEFGYRCHINLYSSPAQQQGFDCHYDTHDVLILQIEGEKEWLIYPETLPYPTADQPSYDRLPPEEPPYLQQVLSPGDLLYIPRGHWHYAIAQETASLHLTIGIHTATGLDWVNWLQQQLRDQPHWRQGLPLAGSCSFDPLKLRGHLESLRDQLITYLQEPQAIDDYLQYLSWQDQPHLPIQLPLQLHGDPLAQGLLGKFIWSPLHSLQWQAEDDQIKVLIGSKQMVFKGLPISLAMRLFSCRQFTLMDLGDWAPDLDFESAIAPLLQKLILAGILFVEADQDAEVSEVSSLAEVSKAPTAGGTVIIQPDDVRERSPIPKLYT